MDRSHSHTTEAEEMYLITVARAVEDGAGPMVPVSEIARSLAVSSVSANQMIKKLVAAGLVDYVPYKGVELTPDGAELANVVLRNRRLWGVFLVDHLGLSPKRADEVACEMEHVTPTEVADRLSEFLGDPSLGPHGKAIPASGATAAEPAMALANAIAGSVVTIEAAAPGMDAFLKAQGIALGDTTTVLGTAPDGSVVIQGPNGAVHLAAEAAATVMIAG